MRKYSPFKDWTWDKEIQSQILRAIESLGAMYANSHRKKGATPVKTPPQMQPDYVAKAKIEAKKQKKEQMADNNARLAELFAKRNNQVKKEENGT